MSLETSCSLKPIINVLNLMIISEIINEKMFSVQMIGFE